MVQYNCLGCGLDTTLPSTYYNFEGPVKCSSCSIIQIVSISAGYLNKHYLPSGPSISSNIVQIENAPDSINDDIREAQLCNRVEANKGCVVLCRRALEGICEDKGASGSDLFTKIQSLHENGFLAENDVELYHEIRFFGNYGAHPKNDLLGEVTKDDSDTVLDLIFHLVRHVYEMPGKLDVLRKRRTGAHEL